MAKKVDKNIYVSEYKVKKNEVTGELQVDFSDLKRVLEKLIAEQQKNKNTRDKEVLHRLAKSKRLHKSRSKRKLDDEQAAADMVADANGELDPGDCAP